jgi:hypothetical protein
MMSPFIYDVEVGPDFRHMHEWKTNVLTKPLRQHKLRKLANLTASFVGIEVGHLHFDEFEIRQSFVAPIRILYSEPCVSRTRA